MHTVLSHLHSDEILGKISKRDALRSLGVVPIPEGGSLTYSFHVVITDNLVVIKEELWCCWEHTGYVEGSKGIFWGHWEGCMRIIVPMTMFGSVPMPCFVHERCLGKGLCYLLYWSQYLVTFPRPPVSSCCFFLSFPRTSAEKGW